MSEALTVESLNSGYGSLRVVRNAGFTVGPGDVAAILGPNGAGKSTLLATLAGALPCESGRIRLLGEDVTSRPTHQRLSIGLGWVPEGRNVFLDLSVRDNLYLSARRAGLRKEFDSVSEEVVDQFPVLARKYRNPAGSLSGGEQQILALGRLLARRPKVALLDEPSVGLGPLIVDTLAEAVARQAAAGVTWIVTEQNVEWLKAVASKTYLMSGGQIVEEDDRHGVAMGTARLRDSYFGNTNTP